MFRPRVIPVLLLKDDVLVKSTAFKAHHYIGDPINAVRLFNRLGADELVFLDIGATARGTPISLDLVRQIGEEAQMPFAVGGGFRSVGEMRAAIAAGAEKVVLGTIAAEQPNIVYEAVTTLGASSVAVCLDVGKPRFGREQVFIHCGRVATGTSVADMAARLQNLGAGEIIVQSIRADGSMQGYDLDLIRRVSETVSVPVVALGGAGNKQHLRDAYFQGQASAVAAGSLFVYQGPRKGVLINYPENTADLFR